jgi:hypothetical protein
MGCIHIVIWPNPRHAPGSLEKVMIRYLLEQAEEQCMCQSQSVVSRCCGDRGHGHSHLPRRLVSGVGELVAMAVTTMWGLIGPQAILLFEHVDRSGQESTGFFAGLAIPQVLVGDLSRRLLGHYFEKQFQARTRLQYHSAAVVGALRFCRVYQRRTEFMFWI